MEEEVLKIFLEVRGRFGDIKEKVSLLKTYFELHLSSPGRAMKLEEFEKVLGLKPELIYTAREDVYGISVIYTIDDDVTRGIMAHEFAELVAREKGIYDHEIIDEICLERGFGRELQLALETVLPGRVERAFVDMKDLKRRIELLREGLNKKKSEIDT